ncbi:MAG TPA: flagellar hook-basal body complex protein FliE [Bacillota bacterium]|jgi:flagellar hook-basal body complex protein FliE|nr:flagellar hook-basal body complex protein FliE [Bacillota bacterium]HOB86153.1 flagellar hook-basal body complex protein FliE [Bacillota bacterium]HOP68864.1 flagellar hook-basal body complex protein FliE [Bacillota bacterium]HPT33371.1 flagellar hook-basal body complex protein FliE [Bacillota bacterium]HPZ64325.1 flagellar hook-basal body complex protein FliE [Bacillota bacterium]
MVEPVQGLRLTNPVSPSFVRPSQEKETEGVSFARRLQEALAKVNRLQVEADEAAAKFVTGELQDIHQLMIKMEEARLALQLTVQVTNKVIEAYQELSRMQI